MTSHDYIQLLNGLGRYVKPRPHAFRPVATLNDPLEDAGLDSLDIVLLTVYVCEIFGIAEALGKSLTPRNFDDVAQFVSLHQTRLPSSVDAALASVM
jgi:acyl carrier protein